jgi:hypothetical protein
MSTRPLQRFWFTFEEFPESTPLNLGCGVTAYEYEDALALLREHVFRISAMPKIAKCIEDVDVRGLDQSHVVPNMGLVTDRGIWFPQGYHQR